MQIEYSSSLNMNISKNMLNKCNYFWDEKELFELSEEVLKLFVLINQLATDVKYEGRISHEYLEEKVGRILKRIPIVLHEKLQSSFIHLKSKITKND